MTTYADRITQEFFSYVDSINTMKCRPLPGSITNAKVKHIRKLVRYRDIARWGKSDFL